MLNLQIDNVQFLSKIKLNDLNFYPLNFKIKNELDNIKTLDELFDFNLVTLNEVDFNGDVGNIQVTNHSQFYLFIVDGEAIIGAKQNRIAERSVIIPPYSSNKIPVYCVEKNRWSYEEDINFCKSEFILPPTAREEKAELLKKGEKGKVQNQIWEEVSMLSEKLQTYNSTDDLGDILDKSFSGNKFDFYDKLMYIPFNSYIIEGAGRTFIEFFFKEDICKNHVKKSLKSWLADTNLENILKPIDTKKIVKDFINSKWEAEEAISIEQPYSSDAKNNGRSIFFAQKLIHAYYYI